MGVDQKFAGVSERILKVFPLSKFLISLL